MSTTNDFYVYEILIDDKVIYVGMSQNRNLKYPETDPHHYERLLYHGYFLLKSTAKKRLEQNRIKRLKREILEAKVQDKKISYNIPYNHLSVEEAIKYEQELISKYGIKIYVTDINIRNENGFEKIQVGGQLINKINSPKSFEVRKSVDYRQKDKNGFNKWYVTLSEEDKKEYFINRKERLLKWRKENPERVLEIQKKWIEAGKHYMNNLPPERLEQMSESMKKRWARNESWIKAKNEQSRQFMKRLNSTPEAKERSRNACINRNKNPEWQLEKVKKLFFAIKNNNKSFENWKVSYKELVMEGKYPQKSFRDWKKYFDSEESLLKYCYEN